MKGLLALDGDLEDLNGWGQLLIKDCVTPDGEVIQERMDSLKARCDALGASGVERETALEESMLSLGQFEGAYDDMWEWLAGTVRKLEEFEPIAGDPDAVAVLLAKHKVRPWCCCSSCCCCCCCCYVMSFCSSCCCCYVMSFCSSCCCCCCYVMSFCSSCCCCYVMSFCSSCCWSVAVVVVM